MLGFCPVECKQILSTSLPGPWKLLTYSSTLLFFFNDLDVTCSRQCSYKMENSLQILTLKYSFQFSRSVMSNSLWPHEPQHTRPPCPSPTPGVHPNPCPSSWWCHPTISSSVIPFSSYPQSFPASGSFPMSQLFPSGGQSIGVSASTSVLPVNTQDWPPLGWTSWISLQSKGLSRVFFNTTVQKLHLELLKVWCLWLYSQVQFILYCLLHPL